MIDRVDVLLWRWAQATHTEIAGMGYPSKTIEYRIQREGTLIRGTPQSTTPSFRIDHEVMEVDRAVKEMRLRWREVVRARYLAGMGDKQGAEYLKLSPGTFRRDLDLAHAWLGGRLGIP